MNQHFVRLSTIDLDKLLHNNEKRTPNNLGLYRLNCLVVGKTGSGKTTFVLKALLSGAFEEFKGIIFIIPRESIESGFYKYLNSLNQPQFGFIIIGEDDLPSIERITQLSKQLQGPIALVLDDFINAFKKDEWLLFKRYTTQLSRVPFGCSLFVLTQNLLQFPTTYRKNFNCFILFVNSLTLLQFKEILRSYYDHFNLSKEQLDKLFNMFKSEPHEPLVLINCENENQSMMFKGYYITPNDILTSQDYQTFRDEDYQTYDDEIRDFSDYENTSDESDE